LAIINSTIINKTILKQTKMTQSKQQTSKSTEKELNIFMIEFEKANRAYTKKMFKNTTYNNK